ncbi:MAG: hypothetical protein M1816_006161 [Peltula sp. TS41687]|nr:MAG: hypothetical protein M1816_006161 [Peltula sp. TS41687]
MSGRSAIVRKHKGAMPDTWRDTGFQLPQAHKMSGSLPLPLPLPPPQQQFAYYARQQQEYAGQHYVPALNIIDFDFDAPPALTSRPIRPRQPSNARSAASISSWSSVDDQSASHGIPVVSRIERSAFRTFMDSKSDALRNKLSFRTISSKTSSNPADARSITSDMLTSPPNTARASNGTRSEVPASPMIASSIRRVQRTADAGMSVISAGSSDDLVRYGEHYASVKRWAGGGRLPEPWRKLRKDPELWDPTGDTLVHLSYEGHGMTRPSPSLRVHSSVLQETGSIFLSTILREGYIDQHDYDFPASPALSGIPRPDSVEDLRVPSDNRSSDIILPLQQPRLPHSINSLNPTSRQPTPPRSEFSLPDKDHPIRHEIFFPAPPEASKQEFLRYHLTTRNVFALLYNKKIVGLNLYQILVDLHERLQLYMPSTADTAGMIIDYLVFNRVDDIRKDPASAAGLLAWSECATVRWFEGWREAFVHCSGMYGRLKYATEFRDVSKFSSALLERASLEIHVRVQRAADKLAEFDFTDMWPMQSVSPPPARSSFDRFRKFLVKYYEAAFWAWPPLPRFGTADIWLTRDVVQRLQKDFGALYDYLVDRDLVWVLAGSANDRNPKVISKGQKPHFRADGDGLPMTDILVGFDNRNHFPHVPHPFPLLPASTPVQIPTKQSLFGKKSRGTDTEYIHKRIALEYSEATNIFALGTDFGGNELVEAYSRFEKSDQLGEVDPYQARRGRWILLYGVLQVLATIAPDTPNLRHTQDVLYYLNPRLRGTPPWREHNEPPPPEATHYDSYCWTAPTTWKETDHSVERSGLRNHREIVIKTAGIGDGTGRGTPGNNSITEDEPSPPSKEDQYTRQWVSGDRFADESKANQGKKLQEWPIKEPNHIRVREVGVSDYVAPADW